MGSAITQGQLDGERHPNVGMIVFYDRAGLTSCSATLVSSTVLVTAAHCLADVRGEVLVTFDSTAPRITPLAADDPGNGTSTTGYSSAAAGWLWGSPHAHPAFDWEARINDLHDVGVVVLHAPYLLAVPAPLPPRGHLDTLLGRAALQRTLFTTVGYGGYFAQPATGPRMPRVVYDDTRRFTEEPGSTITSQILMLAENGKDSRGGGGTCYGDSGGPVFQGGFLVANVSFGYGEFCRSQGIFYRLDTDDARNFLRGYVEVP